MYPSDNYKWLNVVYFIGGIYNPEKINSAWRRKLLRIYNYFLFLLCFVYFHTSQLAYIPKTTNDAYTFINNFGLIIVQTLGCAKWIILLYNRSDLDYIMDTLECEDYYYEDCKDFKPGETMFMCRKQSRIMIMIFFVLGHFIPLTLHSRFILGYRYHADLIGTENFTCMTFLSYYNWIPFNIETQDRCLAGFLFQSSCATGIVTPIISFDLTFIVIAIYIRGNLLNIRRAFLTSRKRCLARLGLPEDYTVMSDKEHPALEKEIQVEVRKLSVHLQEIIGVIGKLENICKFAILGQALCTLFVLVTCLYMLSVEPLFGPMFLVQMQYCMCMFVQFSSYCVLGNEVTSVSSDISFGIYDCDWLSCTKSIKSTLMINLIRLQKPIYFTIGNFSPLTLNTFISIVKGSYSFFTFLDKT